MPEQKTTDTPEIEVILKRFNEIGRVFNDHITRLTNIGNRLHDDSGAKSPAENADKNPRASGRIAELNDAASGMESQSEKFYILLSKIEKFI